MGGAHSLMSSKCSAQRFLLFLTGDEACVVKRIGEVLTEGGCARCLNPRCVLELANHIVFRNGGRGLGLGMVRFCPSHDSDKHYSAYFLI